MAVGLYFETFLGKHNNPLANKQLFLEYILSNYNDYINIYTDGSNDMNSAFYVNGIVIKQVIKINDYFQ